MKVICEISSRHYHPSHESAEKLTLTKKRDLSQGEHWVAHERVEARGASFAVVMPPREKEVYEMSTTEWYKLMEGEPQYSGTFQVKLRHFHCDAKTAEAQGLKNGDMVSISSTGIRAGTLDNIVVRIDSWSVPRIHLDTDEANALGIKNGDEVEVSW